jgi:two-component sensor histidine kinase
MRGFLSILRDRTEARRQEERRTLLLRELDHRVKNTLAVVQSVASQTERSTDAPASFREAFSARLMALARAHDMLARGGWEGASLREVIERTLDAHAGDAQAGGIQAGGLGTQRFTLDGPPVLLPPNATVTVHLGFHELATNAAKHGSLSAPDGQVEVSWTLAHRAGGRVLDILWRERGGPPVRVPDRRGFGSRLLEQGLAREFGGEVRLDFQPEGVACRMRLTLATAGAGAAA